MKKQINLLSFLMILLIIFMCGCTVKPNEPDDKPPINNNQNNNEDNDKDDNNDITSAIYDTSLSCVTSGNKKSVKLSTTMLETCEASLYLKFDDTEKQLDWNAQVANVNLSAEFAPIAMKILKHETITENKYEDYILSSEISGLSLEEVLYMFPKEIMFSDNDMLINNYFSDISSPVCYHNILYHSPHILAKYYFKVDDPFTNKQFSQWHEDASKNNMYNIIGFVTDFKIAKDDFIALTKKANLEIDADIVYSNDSKKIFDYFKDTDMDIHEYTATYYTISPQLMELAKISLADEFALVDPSKEEYKRIYDQNKNRIEWMNKYKGDWSQINIVNFIKDFNISKQDFIKAQENGSNRGVNIYYNADVLFSGDQAKIDEVYKLK